MEITGDFGMIVLTLTNEESAALRQLIDLAVRGHGIKVAQVSLFFDTKIAKAMEEATTPNPTKATEETTTPPPPMSNRGQGVNVAK